MTNSAPTAENISYGQILKSSSIMGGVAAVGLLLGMVRTKFAAVLIGTTGVGLAANLGAIQGIVGTLAGLGIQSSAVRDVASAYAKNDDEQIGRTVLTLRRICWFTGLIGAVSMLLLSPWLSQLSFGSADYRWDIAALGIIILLGNLQGGQMALIQGTRRIADMARVQMIGAVLGTGVTICFYLWLGLRGIVPALVVMSVVQLTLSWRFAKRVPVPVVQMSWMDSLRTANGMVRLGLAMMWTGLLGSAVAYATNALITHQIGLQAVGVYSAAFALSGMFVNFVLGAMGADYYPRLASLAHDKVAMNRLVNEQTEIGLLLAIPGLLATLALAPLIVRIFYTIEFLPAVELLQWFILGCLGRVITWPMSMLMLALKESRKYILIESSFQLLHLAFIAAGLVLFGLKGAAIAFFAQYIAYAFVVYTISRRLTGFRWPVRSSTLVALSVIVVISQFILCRYLSVSHGAYLELLLAGVVSFVCVGQIFLRIRNRDIMPAKVRLMVVSFLGLIVSISLPFPKSVFASIRK